MRGGYLGFFPKSIKAYDFLTTFIFIFIFFRFLVFAQNRPQNNDDDWMFWSGEKARKITVYNLGIFLSKGLG